VAISKEGLVINVEEARTLLGVSHSIVLVTTNAHKPSIATAYVNADLFDEYTFSEPTSHSVRNRQSESPPSSPAENPDDEQEVNVAFEIPLNTLIECLNIFGTAGALPNSNIHSGKKERKWRRADDDDEGGFGEDRETRTGPIDNYFSRGKDEKRTGMRMSFVGAGYPLTLLMWVSCASSVCSFVGSSVSI
jgi:cell cycle checkpoint protein